MEHTSDSVKELFARTTVTPAKSSFESSDREQSWLRIVFAFVAVLWSESHPLDREEKIFGLDAHEFVALSFLFLSIVYFLLWKVTYSRFREKAPLFRWFCVASDISAISLYTATSDRAATILLPIYLSAIIGYGMRFGRSYLIVALILSLLEFCIAEHFNQFLLNNSEILTCYILSMLFLPIYTVILLEKYSVVLNAYKLAFNQKEEFITILSHEFRAPLHSIVSVSESIRLGLRYLGLSKDAERFLSSNIRLILSCTERMLSVANRITSQQNYSRKSQEASTIWFNTYHDIYLAIRVCSVQALRKRLRLSWRLDSNVPCTTTCESSTVQEILINLLDNSLKHTHQGCVALTVRFFPLTDSTGTLEILVSDTGAGMAHSVDEDISPNDSARELSPIVRKSSRLGLAITKLAVARLGGWISSTASFNKGTEILVSIPVDTRIPPATSGEVWLRILVVGDRVLTAEEESLLAGERLYPCYFSIDLDNSEGVAPDTGAFIALLEDEPESATRFFDQFSESYVVHVPVVMLASSLRNGQVSGEPFANFVIDMDYPLEASARLRSLRTFAISAFSLDPSESDEILSSSRVLLIDDSQLTCEATQRLLEMAGLKCEVARTIREAKGIFEVQSIDLVIADLYIDDENFLEFLMHSNTQEFLDIPIILVTADDSPLVQEKASGLGIQSVFVKPLLSAQLVSAVREALSIQPSVQDSTKSRRTSFDDLDLDIIEELARSALTLKDFLRMLDRFQQEIMFDVVKAQRFLKEGELNALGSVFHRMSGVALLFGARSLGEQLKALRAKAVSAEFSNSDRNSLENIDKEIIKFVTFCEKRYRRNWQISESPSASE